MHDAQPTVPVLGGRAANPDETVTVVQMFGPHDAINADVDTGEEWSEPGQDPECPPPQHERLWLIRTWSLEVLRQNVNGGLSNESRDFVYRNGIPGRSGRCAIRIHLTGHAAPPQVYDIDVGQSLEVYAGRVTCRALMPTGSQVINPSAGAGTAPAFQGEVYDALVGCSIMAIEQSRGIRSANLTRKLRVAAAATGLLQIPGGARRVQVSQTAAGIASTSWFQAAGTSTTLRQVLPWIVGARRTESESILENTTHLITDVDVLAQRDFGAVFEIRP
ncbi:MAG: hypothetical protein K0U78_16365 [Actinomycetia bacterium]|nr:hypothetical protein [Actinomycetes bacterium]